MRKKSGSTGGAFCRSDVMRCLISLDSYTNPDDDVKLFNNRVSIDGAFEFVIRLSQARDQRALY